jgi:hypothetical protein
VDHQVDRAAVAITASSRLLASQMITTAAASAEIAHTAIACATRTNPICRVRTLSNSRSRTTARLAFVQSHIQLSTNPSPPEALPETAPGVPPASGCAFLIYISAP